MIVLKFLEKNELILINKYAQGSITKKEIYDWFFSLESVEQQDVLKEIWQLALHSQVVEEDVVKALKNCNLKLNNTPAVVLLNKSEIFKNRGYKLVKMKGKVFEQSFKLILECFAIAARRKKIKCIESGIPCTHWWHENL